MAKAKVKHILSREEKSSIARKLLISAGSIAGAAATLVTLPITAAPLAIASAAIITAGSLAEAANEAYEAKQIAQGRGM